MPVRVRHDGWHPDKQRAFIAALATTRRLDRAALAVGMSRESAYYLRRHRGGKSFAAAWDEIMGGRTG